MKSAVASRRSDGFFWAFLAVSCLVHGMLLATNFSWLEPKPLQVIELDLLPATAQKAEEPPPKGEDIKPLEPAPSMAMPDVKPQPREKPKPPEPMPEPKPLQRVELPKKPKKVQPKPAAPAPQTMPTAAESPTQSEETAAALPAAAGKPDGQPTSRTIGGSEDAVKVFLAQVRQRIDRYKNYPYAARRRLETGRVTVRFVIRPDGSIEGLQVIKKSASSLLDEAALKAVRDAAPFPGFPRDVLAHPLAVEIGLVFELT